MTSAPHARPVSRAVGSAWAVVALGLAALMGVATTVAVEAGPAERSWDAPHRVSTTLGHVTVPPGWELEIAAASFRTPRMHRDDVTITVVNGLWMGDNSSLAARLDDWFTPDGLTGIVPEVADDATRFEIPFADDSGEMVVVRHDLTVMAIVISGPADDRERHADDIQDVVSTAVLHDAPTLAEGERP